MSGGGIREPGTTGGLTNYMAEDQDAAKAIFDFFGMSTLDQMRAYPADSLLTLSNRYMQALNAEEGVLPQDNPTGNYQSYNELMGNRTRQAVRRVNTGPTIDGYSITGIYSNEAIAGSMIHIPYMTGYVSNDVARLAKGIDKFCLLNEEQGNPDAYAYEFARELPGDDAGAFHSGELWYIFNTLGRSWRPMTDADYALSEKMVDCWTNFAKTGNPDSKGQYGWKPFKKDNRQIYVFDIE